MLIIASSLVKTEVRSLYLCKNPYNFQWVQNASRQKQFDMVLAKKHSRNITMLMMVQLIKATEAAVYSYRMKQEQEGS